MKINIIPANKLAMLSAAVCAVMLAFTNNARADATLGFFPDTHVVGTITPAAPADPADVATYINFMITLTPGTSGTFSGQSIARSTNLFGSLPTASDTGSVSTRSSRRWHHGNVARRRPRCAWHGPALPEKLDLLDSFPTQEWPFLLGGHFCLSIKTSATILTFVLPNHALF